MDILPNETIGHILDYLGKKSLVRCLLVNYQWNAIASYLLKSVRLELGFHPATGSPALVIDFADNYVFYSTSYGNIEKYNLLSGESETLVEKIGGQIEVLSINDKYLVYNDMSEIIRDRDFNYVIKYGLPKQENLYQAKCYKFNKRVLQNIKILDDNLFLVYNNYVNRNIWLYHRKVTGERIKKICIPDTDDVVQITCSPDGSAIYLTEWQEYKLSVIHVNLLDCSYKKFDYPIIVSIHTMDEQGRLIVYKDKIISIYEQDKIVSSIKIDIDVEELITHNRILYVVSDNIHTVYYY